MNKVLVTVIALAMGLSAAFAQTTASRLAANKAEISLADARSRIGNAVASPAVMTAVMQHLSAENQKLFLADVNKAIADMPASVEEKTAKFLDANYAALKGSKPGNVSTLIAEVFATVPPESLTVVGERLASDVLNRSSGGKAVYTDAQYAKIAVDLQKKINARTAEVDNSSVRSAFAIVALALASNGSGEALTEQLIETLPSDEAKEMARTEWIPSALGTDNRQQSYEAMLASADAGRRPDLDFTLVIAAGQHLDSLLSDIGGKNVDPIAFSNAQTPVLDAVENPLIEQIPTIGADLKDTADPVGNIGGDVGRDVKPGETPEDHQEIWQKIEPDGYQWQTIKEAGL